MAGHTGNQVATKRTASTKIAGEDDMALGYQLIGNGPAKVLALHGWFSP
jgi:hypothetical protein